MKYTWKIPTPSPPIHGDETLENGGWKQKQKGIIGGYRATEKGPRCPSHHKGAHRSASDWIGTPRPAGKISKRPRVEIRDLSRENAFSSLSSWRQWVILFLLGNRKREKSPEAEISGPSHHRTFPLIYSTAPTELQQLQQQHQRLLHVHQPPTFTLQHARSP